MPLTQKRAAVVRQTRGRRSSIPLRDQIRDTARDLFAREGYESVSMRRIGAEIGCSPMAIYRHYENKEELLLSICEETFNGMIQALDKAWAGGRERRWKNCGAACTRSWNFISAIPIITKSHS